LTKVLAVLSLLILSHNIVKAWQKMAK